MNDKEHQRHRLIYHTNGKSLEEINGTVEVPKNVGFFKMLLTYSGITDNKNIIAPPYLFSNILAYIYKYV